LDADISDAVFPDAGLDDVGPLAITAEELAAMQRKRKNAHVLNQCPWYGFQYVHVDQPLSVLPPTVWCRVGFHLRPSTCRLANISLRKLPSRLQSKWSSSFLYTDTILESHVKDGVLTKKMIWENHSWVLTQDVKILIEALLRNGLENGTLSWDALVMKPLSLLLQISTGLPCTRDTYACSGSTSLSAWLIKMAASSSSHDRNH
jgi:hypothetical protein